MTQLLVKSIADFSTTLTSKTSIGATTATLTSGIDSDGVQLPTGVYGFTIDRNNAQKEHFTATLNGDALTDIKTVTRGTGVGTTGLIRTHRKGAEIVITDHVAIKRMMNVLDGTTSFDSATPLGYDGAPTISTGNQFATKTYVDGVAIAGGVDASTTLKGISKLSTAPVSAIDPIAVGTNDARVPTQDENDALVGTSGTPSSSNKYVTDADTTGTGSVVRSSAIPSSTDVQAFTTAGSTSWTKPDNAKWVEVTVIGPGANGASGNSGAAGGNGGGYGFKKFDASALGATETVVVGASNGAFSSFGTSVLLKALGGASGGTANGDIHYTGGAGGAVGIGTTGNPGADIAADLSPRGGGAAGYDGSTPTNACTGGIGGSFITYYTKTGGVGGNTSGTSGTAATSTTAGLLYGGVGGGGGGRAASSAVIGGGGAGGFPGGGGGGGGVTNGGGAGADGMVYVVTYF